MTTKEKAEKKLISMTDDDGSSLFTWPADKPQLIGSKCKTCAEVVFPKRHQCPKCYTETMEEILLSTKGKVYSSTISYLAPWTMYKGTIPYAIGHVKLREKVLIPCRFSEISKAPISIGTEVKLAIEEWGQDDEGNTIMMPTFRRAK